MEIRTTKRATVIEPMGDLSVELFRRLRETLHDAKREGGEVVISLRGIPRVSWGALCELSDFLHQDRTNGARVRFGEMAPRMRSLLHETGLGRGWHVDGEAFTAERRIVVAAEPLPA